MAGQVEETKAECEEMTDRIWKLPEMPENMVEAKRDRDVLPTPPPPCLHPHPHPRLNSPKGAQQPRRCVRLARPWNSQQGAKRAAASDSDGGQKDHHSFTNRNGSIGRNDKCFVC